MNPFVSVHHEFVKSSLKGIPYLVAYDNTQHAIIGNEFCWRLSFVPCQARGTIHEQDDAKGVNRSKSLVGLEQSQPRSLLNN